jgi:hypothetical protein
LQSEQQIRSETGPQIKVTDRQVQFLTKDLSAVSPQPFNPTAMSRSEGRPVVRSPEQLRLHPALKELSWTGVIDEFNDAARLKDQSVPELILITTNGTILAGFGRWQSAVFDGRHEIHCIEYPLGEDEALQFIIRHHQPQRGWNALSAFAWLWNWNSRSSRGRATTCAPEASTKVWQICRKLSILMCGKRLPTSRGLALEVVTSATLKRSSRSRTRDC